MSRTSYKQKVNQIISSNNFFSARIFELYKLQLTISQSQTSLDQLSISLLKVVNEI